MPKTPEQINRRMAEFMGMKWDENRCPVCGWPLKNKIEDGCIIGNCSVRPAPETRAIDRYWASFNPYHNIADAERLMDKLEEMGFRWVLRKNTIDYYFGFVRGIDEIYGEIADLKCEAICLAVDKLLDAQNSQKTSLKSD